MTRAIVIMSAVVIIASGVPCLGATLGDLQTEYVAIERQITELEQKPSADENIKKLQDAAAGAESALEKAHAAIPEIRAADAKVAAARKKFEECQAAVGEAIQKHAGAEVIQAPRQAMIDAINALQKADRNDKEKYAALEKAFADASKVLRDAYAKIPQVRDAEASVAAAGTQLAIRTAERDEARRKNADVPAVKAATEKLAAAKDARAKAMAEIPEMKELLSKRADVQKRLIEAMRKEPAGK